MIHSAYEYRKALTEMSVLSDVLKVVQHQNYLSLAPVVQECPKPPVAVKLKAKRKVWKTLFETG